MATKENVFTNTDKRLFYLSDDVDRESIGKLCFNLIYLLHEDDEHDEKEKNFERKPICIYVNSFGGSVYDMWALIDIILHSKTPIHTYCTGYAMSAGFQIFLSGHERYASKNATLLYHQLSGWNNGRYMDMKQDMEERDRNQKDIEDFVLSRTKITANRIEKVRTEKLDWYIHSEDFERLGIAKVIE